MSNSLMGNMLTEVVCEKVIKDKYGAMFKEQAEKKKAAAAAANKEREEQKKREQDSDLDSDDDFNDDEAERIMQGLKFQQIQKAKVYQERQKETFDAGDYREIVESEFLQYVTKNVYCAVHFYHQEFERCKIFDMHLKKISYAHPECRFLKLDAEKAQFFVGKLAIQVLPTIVTFENGVAKDRVVGFGELGNNDEFDTLVLTRRLVKAGCIKAKNKLEKGFQFNMGKLKDDDDDYSD